MRAAPTVPLVMCLILALATAPGCSSPGTPEIVATPTSTASGETTSSRTPTSTDADPTQWPPVVRLEKRWDGFKEPLLLTHSGDDSGRLFVVEQGGTIRVIADDRVLDTPFLDVSDLVSTGGERGLLGLAFAPDYSTSGTLYINYTDAAGDTVIARYRAKGDGAVADPGSAQTVLKIAQPYANHNGGCIEFGPDGYLYIGMGDGGSGGDPKGNGQNPGVLLGKLLRIDVARTPTYRVPADNPFVGRKGYRPEIWALGMRNPWRFSFDRETGDLFIADVGQDAWEEIDVQAAGDKGGANYGWNRFEGAHPYPPDSPVPGDADRFTLPIAEYDHSTGESITGGFVYRGTAVKSLWGVYVYADYVKGTIWGLARFDGTWRTTQLADTGMSISSFGEDATGEVYVLDIASGTISALAP